MNTTTVVVLSNGSKDMKNNRRESCDKVRCQQSNPAKGQPPQARYGRKPPPKRDQTCQGTALLG